MGHAIDVYVPGHPENEWGIHDLISDIYRQHSDTVYCSWKGGRQRGNGRSKSSFLEDKVLVKFDFRIGAKKSGQSGHSFRSYDYLSI